MPKQSVETDDEVIVDYCLNCRRKTIELVRWLDTEAGLVMSHNKTQVCINKSCWAYININNVGDWKPVNIRN